MSLSPFVSLLFCLGACWFRFGGFAGTGPALVASSFSCPFNLLLRESSSHRCLLPPFLPLDLLSPVLGLFSAPRASCLVAFHVSTVPPLVPRCQQNHLFSVCLAGHRLMLSTPLAPLCWRDLEGLFPRGSRGAQTSATPRAPCPGARRAGSLVWVLTQRCGDLDTLELPPALQCPLLCPVPGTCGHFSPGRMAVFFSYPWV